MDVAIIKYNAGNIYSVSYALKRLGVEATITADPELLCKADKVIFPGVGEAQTTMEHLKEHKLDALIKGLKQPHGMEHDYGCQRRTVRQAIGEQVCLFRT